jgi:hypothetical protein
MDVLLKETLVGFSNVSSHVRRGITHTNIRVLGESEKIRNPGFLVDIYINRRTQVVSIARIDTGDIQTLNTILSVVSHFQF